MSLIFITAWVRKIKNNMTPWTDDTEKCECDPKWSCSWAISKFYGHRSDEVITPYITEDDDKLKNRHRRDTFYKNWQYTEIDSVNDRIRIYR